MVHINIGNETAIVAVELIETELVQGSTTTAMLISAAKQALLCFSLKGVVAGSGVHRGYAHGMQMIYNEDNLQYEL
ncbi:jg4662 [Pararge aegeria aegeria]|uniref:Jg4662 protein n=1 Tax=Pararge aegeria aegeria TaxID=348720 RepID=A0A8S4Q9X7_9NEOP|nr:jg4662 [Pararge aegeria aegeria]